MVILGSHQYIAYCLFPAFFVTSNIIIQIFSLNTRIICSKILRSVLSAALTAQCSRAAEADPRKPRGTPTPTIPPRLSVAAAAPPLPIRRRPILSGPAPAGHPVRPPKWPGLRILLVRWIIRRRRMARKMRTVVPLTTRTRRRKWRKMLRVMER